MDSAGGVWEVYEVHRSSHHSLAVSPGLERGWLTFVGAEAKRRLAPYPAEWETLPPAALEQLCAKARDVGPAPPILEARGRGPRIVRSRTTLESTLDTVPSDEAPSKAAAAAPAPRTVATSAADIEAAVRLFTHEARERGMQAIAAMMALKAMLTERFPDSPAAHDIHRVRRWFVEAYYFERNR